MRKLLRWIDEKATEWLIRDGPPPLTPLCDFKRLQFELRPGDVLLVEGRSRVAEVIKSITQSPWSHAALHLGRLHDIRDPTLRERVLTHYEGDPEEQLLIEAIIGKGTIVTPLSTYREDHLRICRPASLSPRQPVARRRPACHRLLRAPPGPGLRHAPRPRSGALLLPWGILPRRWRSSLFQHNAGEPTRAVCSTLIAEAFMAVDYPILPFIDREQDGSIRFFKRNPKLFAPRDFDTSPYFDIIEYPFLGIDELGLYRKLPWSTEDTYYNDEPEGIAHPVGEKTSRALAATAVDERDLSTLPRWLGRLSGGGK